MAHFVACKRSNGSCSGRAVDVLRHRRLETGCGCVPRIRNDATGTCDGQLVRPVPYKADKRADILAENCNIAPVMSPGEVDALVNELIRDFEQNPKNDPMLVDKYKTMLRTFAKDWRQAWHLHGCQKEGWPHYQKIIDRVHEQLHPDIRALATQSNQIGVNPIIVQRIMKSGLAVDKMDQFIGAQASKS